MTRDPPGRRWYQRLLRLYPSDFRDEFGREMTQLYKDRAREERTWRLWGSLLLDTLRTAPTEHLDLLRQDLTHTRRSLLRTPVITATAILTLALAIGAATSVFSVLHAVLLRPLPYSEPDQLIELFEENVQAGVLMRSSALNYLSWTERSQQVQALGAFRSDGFTLSGNGNPELLSGSVMTASIFRVLRLAPIAGRALQPEDEQVGSPRVVVLNETLWRVRFGGDPAIVGQSLVLNGEPSQIVGVVPRAFREVGRAQIGATSDAQLFVPLVINRANENRANHTLRVIGRLRSGVRFEQAREEMRGLAAAMEHEFPASNAHWSVRLERLSDTMLDPRAERSLVLVAAAVVMEVEQPVERPREELRGVVHELDEIIGRVRAQHHQHDPEHQHQRHQRGRQDHRPRQRCPCYGCALIAIRSRRSHVDFPLWSASWHRGYPLRRDRTANCYFTVKRIVLPVRPRRRRRRRRAAARERGRCP